MNKNCRREFMIGCSAAIAAMAGSRLTFAASNSQEPGDEILVVVFLRGGMDGLSAVPVIAGEDRGYYEQARSRLAVPTSGDDAAIPISDQFGFHPAFAPLHELFQAQKLAVVVASGLDEHNRSHFDMMNYIELGSRNGNLSNTGWLARHLISASSIPEEVVMPAISMGTLQPTSLLGSQESIAMFSPASVKFTFHWRYKSWQRHVLRELYASGDTWLHQAGTQTLNAVDAVEYNNPGSYTPASDAHYPKGSFGDNLKSIAQMVKMGVGLRVATVDYGGWDTHEYQGDYGGGYFGTNLDSLARGLHAFYTDLETLPRSKTAPNVTAVVMSEFGRSLKENGSRGTDHGHGNIMLVLGNTVNGGQIYGQWPGLHRDQLYDNRDLSITTDYRRVLSEIIIRRFSNPNLGYVFPDYKGYAPLDIVNGADLEPVYAAEPTLPAERDLSSPKDTTTTIPSSDPSPTPTPPQDAPDNIDNASKIYLPVMQQ